MQENRFCPNCSGPLSHAFPGVEWRIKGESRVFGYARCAACGLIMADPIPTEAEIAAYYANDFQYSKYTARALLKRIQGKDRWLRLRRVLSGSRQRRILDIGCGHGWFLYAARKAGWDCTGVDFPSEATRYARQGLGLKVIEEDFLAADLPEGAFDVVALWHALEHMRDPLAALRRVRALLAPDGIGIIAVPNVMCRGLAATGTNWIWLQPPYLHLWHFSVRTLGDHLARAGWSSCEFSTRDTWDAHYLYDGWYFPRLGYRAASKLGRIAARAARVLHADPQRSYDRAFFLCDEFSRLFSYAVHRSVCGLLGRHNAVDGSELLAIARP